MSSISEIFKLTQVEQDFLDKKLFTKISREQFLEPKSPLAKVAKNHLLTDWLNPYVKDLVHLKGFSLQPEILYSMLQGMASHQKIAKSVNFLLAQGFWRKTPSGEIVPEDPMMTTTNNLPNEKIRQFHKKALENALRGLSTLPSDRRKSSTILVSVDEEKLAELRSLIDSFQEKLAQFIEKNPAGSEKLVQITMHLTPVGRKNV